MATTYDAIIAAGRPIAAANTGTTQPVSVRATAINPVLYKEDTNE